MATIEESADTRLRRVLIAVDASPQSEEAFSWYFENIHKEDTEIILAHCPEQPNFPYYTFDTETLYSLACSTKPQDQTPETKEQESNKPGMAISGGDWERVVQEHKEATDELIKHFQKRLQDLKVKHKVHVQQQVAGAGDAICQVAESEGVDHIVIGSRGMGAIRRTILGSVSDYVLHHAKVPVTVHLRRH
ncbi:unnamed protein product [Owenia fusiformis]|uniref:Uncharacterized protein n=1 Tax=Owenia fusiformis TaxID=6347 RepID=A0A8J1Y0N4_OWEFU|nr:unnamed protein product [Owenia fusiformis]